MHELGTIVYVIDTVEKIAAENKLTELKIETLPAVTFCQDCKQTYPTVEFAKECPHCHSTNTFLVTGNEYNIKEIEGM